MGRTQERKTKRLPVVFSNGNIEQNGTSSNFSYTGMFIRTNKPFQPGISLKIVIHLNDETRITLKGVIIWAHKTRITHLKNGMGIEFTSTPQEYIDFVTELG